MELKGRRFVISGQVQGVFYRAGTKNFAKSLGISGWVRNLPDGKVETTAYGSREQLEQFESWLWQGPPTAQITGVRAEEVPVENIEDFEIR